MSTESNAPSLPMTWQPHNFAYSGAPVAKDEPDKTRKVALIGYTFSQRQAPWEDESWSIWGINDLHQYIKDARWGRWFDLHDLPTIRSNTEHVAWLSQPHAFEVELFRPQPEWPATVAFPRDDVEARFPRRYFTNSISWMLARAIMEVEWAAGDGAEIGLWGIDMATGTEYAAQRPSVEYWCGLAEGMGIEITIAETSDLLKCSSLYGAEDSALFAKLSERITEMESRKNEARQQMAMAEAHARDMRDAICTMDGAIEAYQYVRGVWTPSAHDPSVPRADNDVRAAAGG